MTLKADELRELIEHLNAQWALYGTSATTLYQPAARRGRPFEGSDVARAASVKGLASHVHETAAAILTLLGAGHLNAAIPLVRQAYECSLIAVWLIQSTDDHGIKAVLAEHTRTRLALQRDARQAASPVFREGADEIADTDSGPFLGTFDSVRNFEQICLDLAPGGSDAYIYYRLLSTYSHASLGVSDLYWDASPPGAPYQPRARPTPNQPLTEATLLYFVAISMVWGGRAFTYSSRSKPHRSVLRDAAKELEINSEIDLSGRYRERHAAKRRPDPGKGL